MEVLDLPKKYKPSITSNEVESEVLVSNVAVVIQLDLSNTALILFHIPVTPVALPYDGC